MAKQPNAERIVVYTACDVNGETVYEAFTSDVPPTLDDQLFDTAHRVLEEQNFQPTSVQDWQERLSGTYLQLMSKVALRAAESEQPSEGRPRAMVRVMILQGAWMGYAVDHPDYKAPMGLRLQYESAFEMEPGPIPAEAH